MKYFLIKLLFILSCFNLIHANENIKDLNKEGQIVLKTIIDLEKKGYITNKNSVEAKKDLVFNNKSFLEKDKIIKEKAIEDGIAWGDYFSLVNVLKILAIVALLVAFRGFVLQFLFFFTLIPMFIYQTLLMSLSITLTFFPEIIWQSQAYYLSLFGVILNLIILTWIVATYENFFEKIFKLISLNMPIEITLSFYSMLYFGIFTIFLESQFLGIIALIGFVGTFGFTMRTTGLCTYIGYDSEDYVSIGMFNTGILLLIYSYIQINDLSVPSSGRGGGGRSVINAQ